MPTDPTYELPRDWGYGRNCRVCGLRLKRWEHGVCSRERCNDEKEPPFPVPVTGRFGADGATGE